MEIIMEETATTAEPTQETEAQPSLQTAQQVSQEAPQTIVNPDGTFREGWTQDEGMAKRFTSVDSLVGSYRNLERMMSGEKMPIPKEDSPQDVWDYTFNQLGRPENAADYEIGRPEGLPENIPWDDGQVEQFKDFAHKLGLSQKQVSELVNYDANRLLQGQQQQEAFVEQNRLHSEQALKDAWGPKYEAQLELAQKAAQSIAPDIVDDPVLADNPKVIEMMAKVGAMMSEGRLKGGRDMNTPFMGAQELQQNIDQVYAKDYSNPWTAKFWSGDAKAAEVVMGWRTEIEKRTGGRG
jgi:hypothetical protein